VPLFRHPSRPHRAGASRRPRLLACVAAALAVLVAAGCEMRTTVEIAVAEDGSGTVTVVVELDAEALDRVPDLDADRTSDVADLGALVRTDDLEAAGWTVAEPVGSDDGGATLRVSRAFGTPAEAEQILDELTGPDGALRDLAVDRSTSFGRTDVGVTGRIDLSGGLEAFGDDGLAFALEGEPLGEDAAAIEARIGRPLAEAVTFEVITDIDGEASTWSPRLGDQPQEIGAERTFWNVPVLVLAAVAVVAAVALVVLLVVRALRSRSA
jgi:hypothetical protein